MGSHHYALFNNVLVLMVFYMKSLGKIEMNIDETSAPIS